MAFGQRGRTWNIHYLSMWADTGDTEKNIAFTRELAGAMKPWSTGRVYLNFLGDEGQDRVESGFGTKNARSIAEPQGQVGPDQSVP